MMFVTQLIYLHPGKESVFDEFESVAIPLIRKHGGELLLRVRPAADNVIERSIDIPYEIHIVTFPSDEAFAAFAKDEAREGVLHLKDDSVRSSLLVRGTAT
jgi:uncharacterized protein (DUF1330 family)